MAPSDALHGLSGLQEALLGGEDLEAPKSATVEVRDISYELPREKRQILQRVHCSFPAGKLSAIMGASGSGKTSLLTLIRGLSCAGSRLSGQVLCDSRPVSVDLMRDIASVVPQEDVFLSALTPFEMLSFAAELRLPKRTRPTERQKRVQWILSILGLDSCKSTKIGNEALGVRGISGGERRRLSVGLSIIGGLPQLLLCDEPTSGLDSAAATSMVALLRQLANRGVTVLCAIHQPSFDLFSQFHSLLLLQGGRAIYAGSLLGDAQNGGVEAFFSQYGCPTPAHTNPAHHYITEIQARGDVWADRWTQQAPLAAQRVAEQPPARTLKKAGSGCRRELGFFRQTDILTRRTLLENFKNRKRFFAGVMSRLPASIMIGFFFWRIAAVPTQHSIFPLKGVLFLAIQNPLIETFYAGAATFQTTKGLLKREYYDGLYQVAPYYLAYYIGFFAMQVPWTCAWAIPLYFLVGLPPDLYKFLVFLLTTFMVILMACAAGSAVGTRTKDAEGNRAVLMPAFIPTVLFSGYVIPYAQIPLMWKPLYYLSPMQWGMSILETNQYQGLVFEDCDAAVPREARHCFATGEEWLSENLTEAAQWLGVSGMLALCAAYIGLFMVMNIRAIHTCVLDGRV